MEYRGLNILLFIPNGEKGVYAQAIKKELVSRGCTVTLVPERPSNATFDKIVLRLVKKILPSYFASYIKKVIEKERGKQFDYIIVVRGEGFSPLAMKMLKSAYPAARYILYAWDLLATTDLRWVLKCFDRIISFDYKDAKDNNMIFRPLFFLPQDDNQKKDIDIKYQLYMVGTITSKVRYSWMKKIEDYMRHHNYNYFFYYLIPSLPSYWLAKFKGIIPFKSVKSEYSFTPLPHKEQMQKLAQSLSMLDIPHPLQIHSLNMRPFEAMATRTKLITTSQVIRKYNFYRPENIYVLSSEVDFNIPNSFFESSFVAIHPSIKQMYSVAGWVDDLFELNKDESYKKFFTHKDDV